MAGMQLNGHILSIMVEHILITFLIVHYSAKRYAVKIESVNKDSLKILFCCDIIILETKRRHFDVSHVHTAPLHMLFPSHMHTAPLYMLFPPPLFHSILPFFFFLYRHNSGGMQSVALSKVQAVQV